MKIVELHVTCWVGLTIIPNFDSPYYHCRRNPCHNTIAIEGVTLPITILSVSLNISKEFR